MTKTKPKKRVKAGTNKGSALDRKNVYIEAFLSNGGNSTQAALTAGYSAKGASKAGYRLSKDVYVLSELDKRKKVVFDNLKITTERILLERARMAFFDPRKLFDAEGKPIPIQELDDDTAAALAGMDVVEEYVGSGNERVFVGYTKKYKLADKHASLASLERQMGMYEADNKQ